MTMALIGGAIRAFAAIPKASSGSAALKLFSAGFATDAPLTTKEVAYLLDNRDDPEVDAAIKTYLKAQYGGAKPTASSSAGELASRVEKKYIAAQVVAQGVQNIALPLGYSSKDTAPIKRFAEQLRKLGCQAGFESAAAEIEKRLAEKAKTAETVKEFLGKIEPFTSSDFHVSLTEALGLVESEINSSVTFDASSEGYKKFAAKVQAISTASGIPWKTLVDAKKPATASDDAVKKSYQAWLQGASVADATSEIEVLKAEAASLLDKHLAKTADEVRKDQESSLASLVKKLDSAKGSKWAEKFQQDLKNIAWFDAAVAASPVAGPKATA